MGPILSFRVHLNPLAPNGPYLDHELWLHKILSKIIKKKNLIIDSKYSENFFYKNKKKITKNKKFDLEKFT